MKSLIPILSLLIIFSSCTTAYKSGQTPDDVYFSPARPQDEYVRVDKEEERQYRDEYAYRDERFLRYKVRNRNWSSIDEDYYYNYRPYYSYSPYYSNPYYNHNYWNYCYNPYARPVIVPVKTVYSAPRSSNMSVYTNPPANTNPKGIKTSSGNNSTRTTSGSRSTGGFLRDVFRGSTDSGSSSSGSSSGSGSSGKSSSSGSSSSGSSSSGATKGSVRKF